MNSNQDLSAVQPKSKRTKISPHVTSSEESQKAARGGHRKTYSFTQAAKELGVSSSTLAKWCEQDQITPGKDRRNHRLKLLTISQLKDLAKLHYVTLGQERREKDMESAQDDTPMTNAQFVELVNLIGQCQQGIADLYRLIGEQPRMVDTSQPQSH